MSDEEDAAVEFDVVDFKGLFTIAKSLWTARGIVLAGRHWRDKDSPLATRASRLLALDLVLLAAVTAYKLVGDDRLDHLFALQLAGHYSSLLTFAALAGFGSHPEIRRGKRGDR